MFGLNTKIQDNAFFFDESVVIYAVGHEVVLYNFEKKTQKIIHLQLDGDDINCMALNLVEGLLVVGSKTTSDSSTASVNLYDIASGKRKKIFKTGDAIKEIQSVSFSGDGKYLLAQGVGPEWCIKVIN